MWNPGFSFLCCLTLAAVSSPLHATVTLEAGKTDVVIEENASPVVKFAADEATNFLSRVFGVPVPIVNSPREGRAALILGVNGWSHAEGINLSGTKRDAYAVKPLDGRVFVAGVDSGRNNPMQSPRMGYERGTLMGVYGFLEEYAGCRFYFPGELGEITPSSAKVCIPDTDKLVTPNMPIRTWHFGGDGEMYDDGGKPSEKRKLLHWLRVRASSETIKCCHGTAKGGLPQKFAKSHPEYFSLNEDGTRFVPDPDARRPSSRNGHFCYSSGIRDEIVEDCMRRFAEGAKYVDIMPNDAMPPCQCEKCQAAYVAAADPKHPARELIWGYTKYVADKIAERGAKGFVTQMVYAQYGGMPPEMDIPPNVYVMVAGGGPRQPHSVWQAEFETFRAWKRKSANPVWVWNYLGKTSKKFKKMLEGVPNVMPRATGEYYKALAGDIIGAFAQCDTDKWIFNYLNYYVLSHVMWDTRTDVAALLDEHHRLMFGAGAAPMARFYGLLEEKWVGYGGFGVIKDGPLGPVFQPPSEVDLWTKVYGMDTIAKLDGFLKEASAAVVPGSMEARRIEFFRREYYDPLAASSFGMAKKRAEASALRWKSGSETPISLVPFGIKKGFEPAEYVRTDVWAERRDGNIIVRFGCEDNRVDDAKFAPRAHDDAEIFTDAGFEILLNPSGDRTNYFHIAVNLNGDTADHRCKRRVGDSAKDIPQWESGVTASIVKRENGWIATVTIPLAKLGRNVNDAFPMEFVRNRITKSGKGHCQYHWSPYAANFHDIGYWGVVDFGSGCSRDAHE